MPISDADLRAERIALVGKLAGCALFAIILLLPNATAGTDGPAPDEAQLSQSAHRLAAVTVLMATLWLTQAMPIAAVALLPLVLFPLLGIQNPETVSAAYIDPKVFLFLGGFVVALGIEKWGLHARMALHIVRLLGTRPSRMVLGFMLATAFLSMWISNTASTLLMLPIGMALTTSLRTLPLDPAQEPARDAGLNHLMTVLLLGIAYAASIGGFTSLVGTPTNVTFISVWDDTFPTAPDISAGEWMLAVAPLGALYLLCAWRVLVWRMPEIPGTENNDRGFFRKRLRELGPASRAERLMLMVFATTALLWVFRKGLKFGDSQLVPGWGPWVAETLGGFAAKDSTVAIGMSLLMFLIPARRDGEGRREYLMDWKTAESLPWGILLLIGGGLALATGFTQTGLSKWLGAVFAELVADWPVWLLVASVCFLLTFLTELTSNVATVATLTPVLASTAVAIGIDPRLMMIPATIAASCAFMLPIATPPNAIVFGSGRITMGQMMRYGLLLNLLGVVLITIATFLLLVPQLGISVGDVPSWLTQ